MELLYHVKRPANTSAPNTSVPSAKGICSGLPQGDTAVRQDCRYLLFISNSHHTKPLSPKPLYLAPQQNLTIGTSFSLFA
jgi:hypothetical protein